MNKRRKGYSLTREEAATPLKKIAERIIDGDRSYDLQLQIQQAQEALTKMRKVDGLKLLNRIALLQLTENGKVKIGFDYVREKMEALPPLHPVEDSNTR